MKKILFTSPGRRVELINFFKDQNNFLLYGADYVNTSPASFYLEKMFKLPFTIDEKYIEKIYNICKENNMDLVIPLIDPEIPLLSNYEEDFSKIKTKLLIPNKDICHSTYDKLEMSKKIANLNIKQPVTISMKNIEALKDIKTENLIIKPKKGSSSKNVFKIKKDKINDFINLMDLRQDDFIIQECIDYDFEVTVDAFSDLKGNIVEICQRKRLKVRGGEVERAVTMKDRNLEKIVEKISKELNITNTFNIQFLYSNNNYYFLEINPRFGGGYPLSYKSGANFIEHVCNFIENKPYNYYKSNRYIDNYYMLRYDSAIYTKELKELC